MKKKYCLILTMLLIVGILCFTSATAGSASQNGIDVSLTASKAEYAASEDIVVTLSVTNTSSVVIEQVKLQNEVPVGFSLKAGSSATKTVAQLGHDGTASLITGYHYEPNPDVPETGDSTNFV